MKFCHAEGQQWSSGLLWPKITRYAFDIQNQYWSGWSLDQFERTIGPWLPVWRADLFGPPLTGRLGASVDAGGEGSEVLVPVGGISGEGARRKGVYLLNRRTERRSS